MAATMPPVVTTYHSPYSDIAHVSLPQTMLPLCDHHLGLGPQLERSAACKNCAPKVPSSKVCG